jgi:hypothetical protein
MPARRRKSRSRIPLNIDERCDAIECVSSTLQSANNAIHARTSNLFVKSQNQNPVTENKTTKAERYSDYESNLSDVHGQDVRSTLAQ